MTSDHELAELVASIPPGEAVPVVGLAAGDLCASLGGRGNIAARRGEVVTLAPVDLGRVTLSDRDHLFAAHLVARGRLWIGPAVAAMNAERMGPWVVAPRAHPGDGVLDVVEGALDLRERLLARKRARLGEHLPHPDLSLRRTASMAFEFARARQLYVDGHHVGAHRRGEIDVLPAAVVVAV